ncbi:MAG: hypothetical protein CFK48_12190, partial [Armatimonadetes bacterium CP1_7O]
MQQQLLRFYPADFRVYLIHAPGDSTRTEYRRVAVEQLERMPCDTITYLLAPPCPRRGQVYQGFEGLVAVVAALRAPDGCPWDREQTHESLKPHL